MDENARKQAPSLKQWCDGFLLSKRAERLAHRSLAIYRINLAEFCAWCALNRVLAVESLTPEALRQWLIDVAAHHNPGGTHQRYRAVKTFLRWYELEAAPDGWRNPIARVKSPKLPEKILEPVSLESVAAMLAACHGHDREGARDKAILLTLLDTGARAGELCAFTVGDFDTTTGALMVRHGKGDKARSVFAGQRTRRAIRAYLKLRGGLDDTAPLFANQSGRPLTYSALRGVVERRARNAGIPEPSLHSFRRACTLAMLRAGVDLLTIQRLLGHADMSTLRVYAKQTTDDLRQAHAAHSPADGLE